MHLEYALTEAPFFCIECNGQIFSNELEMSEELAGEIALWRTTYASLYHLWLDSGAYESFAKQALLDPKGEVNLEGIRLANELSSKRPTFYWFFSDADDSPAEVCPLCKTALTPQSSGRFKICHKCKLTI